MPNAGIDSLISASLAFLSTYTFLQFKTRLHLGVNSESGVHWSMSFNTRIQPLTVSEVQLGAA